MPIDPKSRGFATSGPPAQIRMLVWAVMVGSVFLYQHAVEQEAP